MANQATPRPGGRRVADVPVDHVGPVEGAAAPYVGRRKAVVPSADRAHTGLAGNHPKGEGLLARPEVDAATVERVLSALEPADQTTSFEHEVTAQLPLLGSEPPSAGGKRRAVKHAGGRGPLFKGLPSVPVLLGVAALAVSIGGAVTVDGARPSSGPVTPQVTRAASALGGASGQGTVSVRKREVTRDNSRDAQADAAGQELQAEAEGMAQERNSAIKQLAAAAEKRAKYLAQDLWSYPLEPVVLTARFGDYGLWSNYHTGLDFNGETGDPVYAVASGEVVSAGYDGSYGNKTVVRLADGTEIWYAHQSAISVSVGDMVARGDVIGLVGATGNVTGSHLHLEVRPGGGDPVDPYPALQQHGLF